MVIFQIVILYVIEYLDINITSVKFKQINNCKLQQYVKCLECQIEYQLVFHKITAFKSVQMEQQYLKKFVMMGIEFNLLFVIILKKFLIRMFIFLQYQVLSLSRRLESSRILLYLYLWRRAISNLIQ
ncbi:unnamed protein product [Paramecium pentaurelia]|uniref:Uncharacterized protein n=1 Tax=Paramecium pentaurelia TaxID=43138 RepID=A0A8S1XA60_9CILI|nr:unnamed protein product [Paramecium pentaurelia]